MIVRIFVELLMLCGYLVGKLCVVGLDYLYKCGDVWLIFWNFNLWCGCDMEGWKKDILNLCFLKLVFWLWNLVG